MESNQSPHVIPAQAGIHHSFVLSSSRRRGSIINCCRWIPAFAGMTTLGVALITVGEIGLLGCSKGKSASVQAEKVTYHCPMHPKYTSEKPGDCPICGMRLVPLTPPPSLAEGPKGEGPRKILYYRNPMRPDVSSPTP